MKRQEQLSEHLHTIPSAKAHPHRPPEPTSKKTARVLAFLLGIQGGLCIVFTEHIYRVLPFLLGITMVALGGVEAWIRVKTEEFRNTETKITANGIVFVLLGFIIVCNFNRADFIIGAIWGVIGLTKGTESLNLAISGIARRMRFVSNLIHCIVELLLGIVLLLDPSSKLSHHVFFLGIELIAVSWHMLRESRKYQSDNLTIKKSQSNCGDPQEEMQIGLR